MIIEFLNVWSGKTGNVLSNYLRKEAQKVDIFCFQEANKTFPVMADEILTDFVRLFKHKFVNDIDIFDQATHVRRSLEVVSGGTILEEILNVGLGLMCQANNGHNRISLVNMHGVSRPVDKMDSDKRLEQSQKIIEYMNTVGGARIIGGDFNLDKDTESVKMFEKNGYRNLIREFGIRTTRNRFAWERFPNTPQLHSSYVFVSPEINVRSFNVVENEVSDHLPLIVEIE